MEFTKCKDIIWYHEYKIRFLLQKRLHDLLSFPCQSRKKLHTARPISNTNSMRLELTYYIESLGSIFFFISSKCFMIFNLIICNIIQWSYNSWFEIGTQRPGLFFCFFLIPRQTAFAESPQVFSSTLTRPCSPFERIIIESTHFHMEYKVIHYVFKVKSEETKTRHTKKLSIDKNPHYIRSSWNGENNLLMS